MYNIIRSLFKRRVPAKASVTKSTTRPSTPIPTPKLQRAQIKNHWPQADYESMMGFYGPVGMDMVQLRTPYPLRLAWDTSTQLSVITVHRKVANSMREAMNEILEVYGYSEIVRLKLDLWGGTLSVRKKRGKALGYSIHSWGAATDWAPEQNRLRTPWRQALFSDADYIPFFNAWIRQGWKPLGLTWGRDVMHIEATANDLELIQPNDPRFIRKAFRSHQA